MSPQQTRNGPGTAQASPTATPPNEDSFLPVTKHASSRGPPATRLGRKQWIVDRFDWSWFTCTQSTGGIAIALSKCPKQFDGLQTIGTVIFVLNLALYLLFCALLVLRWSLQPSTVRRSFTAAPECFFYGSFWLTFATIIIGTRQFGAPHAGPWLVVAVRVCFWIYAAVTLLSTTVHFVVVSRHTELRAIGMNPAWFFLIYNTMLTGTIAGSVAADQPPAQRLPMLVAGVGYQGLGWLVALLILSLFLGSLMEKGWPPEASKAPGLFITVGSAGFTIVALMGCASAAPEDYAFFAAHPLAKEVLVIMATWIGIFLWLFTLWLFGIALFVCLAESVSRDGGRLHFPMRFNNTWWGKYQPWKPPPPLLEPAGSDRCNGSPHLSKRRLHVGDNLHWSIPAKQCH